MTPIVSARICAPQLMPRNCASSVKAAEASGWDSAATIAVTEDGTWSVLLRLAREEDVAGHVFTRLLSALWDGPDRDSMSFYRAWHRSPQGSETVTYTEFGHLLKGTRPKLTPRAQEKETEEQIHMLSAIQMTMAETGASPVRVYATGEGGPWCKGHVIMGSAAKGEPVRVRVRCSRPASRGALCSGPCEVG